MADDFDAAGINWWITTRTNGSSSATTTSFDCSPVIASEQSVSCPILDSSLQIPGFNLEWNQSLVNNTGRAEPSFHALLQESISYPSIEPSHNQQFLPAQHQQQQQQPPLSMMLHGLLEQETKAQQQPIFYHHQRPINYQNPPLMTTMKHNNQSCNLQFSNSTAFWNASASPIGYPSMVPVFEHKPTKLNSDSVQKKSGSSSSSSSEPALKKPRVEAPSPLPTFKVRKEKLGDRITALQQLVSPFGKTDTASVLHEAIEYIKFLHDQVSVLSTPYLKNGHPMQHQQSSNKSKDGKGTKQDLRSRGLCLVPIESTYPVASETTADFWTPNFGGTYR